MDAPFSRTLRSPRFDSAVDVEAHVALLPEGATSKGMLFLDMIRQAAQVATPAELARFAGIPEQRYVAFHDYSMADNLRLKVAVARAIHPRVSIGTYV